MTLFQQRSERFEVAPVTPDTKSRVHLRMNIPLSLLTFIPGALLTILVSFSYFSFHRPSFKGKNLCAFPMRRGSSL